MGVSESSQFLNRELSWLEFNHRVLEEALDRKNPLLERLKFFCIVGSNLDEFFEVRVAGLSQQRESAIVERSLDGRTASEGLEEVNQRIRKLVEQQYRCWNRELRPSLARSGIRILEVGKLKGETLSWIDRYYHEEVYPVLTPLGIDPAHPFPQLGNKSLNIMVELGVRRRGRDTERLAVVQVPRNLPRLVRLPSTGPSRDYVFLEALIFRHLSELFRGHTIRGHWRFRVTRNSELYIDEESIANLLKAVETELSNRRKGDAVRLEVDVHSPSKLVNRLRDFLKLTDGDVYRIDGPISPIGLMTLYDGDHSPELRDLPFIAPEAPALRNGRDLISLIHERDVLLHHPYESFRSIIEFIEQASNDPDVLAIKLTLYRSGSDQRIFQALMDAVKLGKQVTVVVELKARFDEDNNIRAARRLEEAGVHVLYGMVGYKIHCKMCMVVRKDSDGIRRYVHIGTGNYNPTTSRIYTDLGVLTSRPEIGEDVANLFNLLTGICQFQETNKLLVAPFNLRKAILAMIEQETKNASRGLPAKIIAKLNALVDEKIITALYQASDAGVEIDLIVRGICCLRPQVKNLSDNIRVWSIVDRFLEHSRIYYFENACKPKLYIGSADWMPRNFLRRIEAVVPIEDGVIRDRIIHEILTGHLKDNVKARFMRGDGSYYRTRRKEGEPECRSQVELMAKAVEAAKRTKRGAAQRPATMKVKRRPE